MGSNPICVVFLFASIAQSVEQRTENPRVAGSIPARGIAFYKFICGSGSVVEHRLAKARVASSNLVFRFLDQFKRADLFLLLFYGASSAFCRMLVEFLGITVYHE